MPPLTVRTEGSVDSKGRGRERFADPPVKTHDPPARPIVQRKTKMQLHRLIMRWTPSVGQD